MAHSVEMPELGESVTEGTVTQWLKKVGDKVEVDEPLLEVSTDKVDTEIPSPVAGVLLKILAEEDDTVDVGAAIAEIGDEDESAGSEDSSSADSDGADSDNADSSAASDESSASTDNEPQEKSNQGGSGKAEDVAMPELGESVTEGTITQWLKKVGDKVEVDEPLLEVSTDKVDTEIPSPVAGTLVEILAEEDDTVDVGAVIARVGDENATASSASSSSDSSQEEKTEDNSAKDDEPAGENTDSDSSNKGSADKGSSNDGGSGKAEDVTMPELGESVTEGTITQWLKSKGDKVDIDEPLLEVSTDKVDTEIPSPVAGTLVEILAEEDETVGVGEVIARIGDGTASVDSSAVSEKDEDSSSEEKPENPEESKDDADKAADQKLEESAKTGTGASQESSDDKTASTDKPKTNSGNVPYVTPLVRKLAEKHGVDLSTVTGTGVGGRIRKQDVVAAADGTAAGSGKSESQSPAGPRASLKKVDLDKQKLRGTTQKVNRIREITARTTLESLHNAAQLTQLHEVDMTHVADLRAAKKQAFQDKHGVKLTYLPFFAKAIVEALVSHPNVNASYNAESKEMTYHEQVNLGIAVDTPDGLLSPVIHNAQDMSLPELAKAIVDIADRARNKKLKPNDVSGGTFTITNIGSEGALADTPILVPPQAAMVGTGAIVRRPVVITDESGESIGIRAMVMLPMTYDHQVVDGADAGRFMTTVRDRLETADFEADLEL